MFNGTAIWVTLATLGNTFGGIGVFFMYLLFIGGNMTPAPVNWFTTWGVWTVPGVAAVSIVLSWIFLAFGKNFLAIVVTLLPPVWWVGILFAYAIYYDTVNGKSGL